MKPIVKKISCIALTAALLTGGMPVQVLADIPETQQVQQGEKQPEEGLIPDNGDPLMQE